MTQLSREEVVNAIARAMNLQTPFKLAALPNMSEELLKIDETFVKNKHKVGLLRVKAGQTNEEDIFSNPHEAGPFEEFLGLIGQRVKLLGFKKFLGGLDGDRNFTGEESVFTEYKNMEVMFHVATLMPFSANDPQQVRTSSLSLLLPSFHPPSFPLSPPSLPPFSLPPSFHPPSFPSPSFPPPSFSLLSPSLFLSPPPSLSFTDSLSLSVCSLLFLF